MLIAAVGDVHSPRYYEEFVLALDRLNAKPDFFLIAGDMINRGEIKEYDRVYNALFGKITCPIIACFGNNEFQEVRDTVRKKFSEIKFLDDQSIVYQLGRSTIGIYGTTGGLDTPTPWQKANIPNIEKIYEDRLINADRQLQRMNANFKILLAHYSPTYKTLEGENPRFFSSMGMQAFENVINARKPNLVIHGHSHRGLKMIWIDTVPVFNVAFSVNKEIVLIDTDKFKPGITKFL